MTEHRTTPTTRRQPPTPAAPTAHRHDPRHTDCYAPAAQHWSRLDRGTCFLNHGSFGACPDPVLERQRALRDELEAEPVRFMLETLEPAWFDALAACADFLRCDAEGLAFVTNATTAVNAVVNSIDLRPGDEVLTTDHEYNACANALRHAAERAGAQVVTATLPFPVDDPAQITRAVTDAITGRTKLLLIDHVTSPTAMVLPVADIVRAAADRGVDTLIDGAHAPGMIDLDIRATGAAYYAGNWHKWVCAPKGAGFLYAREDRRHAVRPAVISHGANATRTDISRFQTEFAWTGTGDPTPMLCVPEAIRFMGGLMNGGWPALRAANRAAALAARTLLADRLGLEPVCPEEMVGSMAAMALPPDAEAPPADPVGVSLSYPTGLQRRLVEGHGVQVPIVPWAGLDRPSGAHGDRDNAGGGGRLVRVSAQVYNAPRAYEVLAGALADELSAV